MSDDDVVVSAQVVFRTADGRSLSDVGPITAANVGTLAPDPASVDRIARFFRDAGFEVGPAVGSSLSISGPVSLFETVLGHRPKTGLQGRTVRSATASSAALELPLERLPPGLAAAIDAVTFSRPPDFGPTSFA